MFTNTTIKTKVVNKEIDMKNALDFFQHDAFKLFEEFLPKEGSTSTTFNVETAKDHWTIQIPAPGLSKEDFNIDLNNDVLTISYDVSEKKKTFLSQKKYSQSWTLPSSALPNAILATYEQGILSVKIPKNAEPPATTKRRITVK